MKKVKIIGVPEHFNLPWHMAIEEGAFASRGIALEWEDIPEGTGRMAKMLAARETDLAIILTEGMVKSIADGNASKIVQTYIESPLLWGIHVSANSSYQKLSDIEKAKVAISRFGSGSHLMAIVNAQNQNWNTDDLQFEVINNLEGAVNALSDGLDAYFMWERFTTKPLVDKGTFRRLADCPTPWPCFVIAGTEAFVAQESWLLRHILEVINSYTLEFKAIPSIDRTLANAYGQELEDIQEWLGLTKWSQEQLSIDHLKQVQERLKSLDIIDEIRNPDAFLYTPKD